MNEELRVKLEHIAASNLFKIVWVQTDSHHGYFILKGDSLVNHFQGINGDKVFATYVEWKDGKKVEAMKNRLIDLKADYKDWTLRDLSKVDCNYIEIKL